MNAEMISAIVRHLLTAIGAGFAAKYGIDGDTMNTVIGGGAAAAGLAWSLYDKRATK